MIVFVVYYAMALNKILYFSNKKSPSNLEGICVLGFFSRRREGAKRLNLCAFAPLREYYSSQ